MRRFSVFFVFLLLFTFHCADAFAESATVQRIVDGDTVWVRVGSAKVKIRLLCIDALEERANKKMTKDAVRLHESEASMAAGGKAAAEYIEQLIHPGDSVRLEYGPDKFDQYGRTLAYIYRADGTNVNLRLVKDGYAGVLCYAPNDAKAQEFLTALHEARNNRRGLWGKGLILQERWVKNHG